MWFIIVLLIVQGLLFGYGMLVKGATVNDNAVRVISGILCVLDIIGIVYLFMRQLEGNMKKIKDGTYRAVRCDASGYVYGYYRKNGDYIQELGQDNWITPIKRDTLVYRVNGKWKKIR